MVLCFIESCPNSSSQRQGNVTFHRFPKNVELCRRWKQCFGVGDDVSIPESARVCSFHFVPGTLIPVGYHHDESSLAATGKRTRIPVPTEYLSPTSRSPPRKRSVIRHFLSPGTIVKQDDPIQESPNMSRSGQREETESDQRSIRRSLFSPPSQVASDLLRSNSTRESPDSSNAMSGSEDDITTNSNEADLEAHINSKFAVQQENLSLATKCEELQSSNKILIEKLQVAEEEKKSLSKQLDIVRKQCAHFQEQIQCSLRWRLLSGKDVAIRFLTGFEDCASFFAFFNSLGDVVNHLRLWQGGKRLLAADCHTGLKLGRKRQYEPIDELIMTLSRLRLGLVEEDVAMRWNISQSTVSRIFQTWLAFLDRHLSSVDWWLSRERIQATMPQVFRDKYPDTRVIIDATEIFVQQPSDKEMQSALFSSYKHHSTVKGLIGIAPMGMITFVSRLYNGAISDVQLTKDCGILQKLEPGDSVMADRGFKIVEELNSIGALLNIPPFLSNRPQLTAVEVLTGRKIASVRVHVERAIERIKNFRILQTVVPVNMIQVLDSIFTVCSLLCNLLPPLVPPVIITSDPVVSASHRGLGENCQDELAQTATELNITADALADIRQSFEELAAAADM